MKKISLIYILSFFLLLIVIPIGVKAINWETTEKIIVSKDETVDGNYYFLSDKVVINGNINGDLIGIAENLEVNGRVEGDIIAVVQDFNFTGEVVGNIRLIGNLINIKGIVGRNVNLLGVNVFLSSTGQVNWDTMVLASNLDMRSKINGNLYALVNTGFLNGKIERDVNMSVRGDEEALTLGENLEIKNNLYYRANNQAAISKDSKIAGNIEFKELTKKTNLQYVWSLIFKILSTVLLALFLIHLFKKPLRESSENIYKSPGFSLLWGGFFTVVLPISLIVLFLTIVGFKLALFLTSLWLAVFLGSKIIFAYFVGRFILNRVIKKPKTKAIWKIIIGVIISCLLFALPFIGSFLVFIAILFGSGGFFLYLRKLIKK